MFSVDPRDIFFMKFTPSYKLELFRAIHIYIVEVLESMAYSFSN